jgi:small conductance mechanosensitive channel
VRGQELRAVDVWAVHFFPLVAGALAVLVGFLIGARAAGAMVTRLGRLRSLDADLVNVLARGARLTLIAFGVVTAIGTLGIDIKALVTGLGLTGFALGFALKDIISNSLAGILLLIYKPFHRGDHIEVSGSQGLVGGIDMRYTLLITADGSRLLVPNANLFTNSIRVLEARPAASSGADAERHPEDRAAERVAHRGQLANG